MNIWKERYTLNENELTFGLIERLHVSRGIRTAQDLKKFTHRSPNQFLNPSLLKDLDHAVERLLKAKEASESILIFGDYDVDGTTSVSMVYGYLRDLGFKVAYYIPDRYKEGYGFSMTGAMYAIEHHFNLVITLDCGVKDGERIKLCQDHGIDVIVCDHHTPGELPCAYAIINPKRPDCLYPNKGLSGCGVGFKLLQGLTRSLDLKENKLYYYLDFVALSTAADIVPFTEENQLFVYFGLGVMNKKLRPGLEAMFKLSSSKSTTIGVQEMVFIFAPRINAAGRIFAGKRSVDLMLSKDLESAMIIAKEIEAYNKERRFLDQEIAIEAFDQIANDSFHTNSAVTIVKKEGWHKGVVGIVASRLIEKIYKPTLVLTELDGIISGSARSIPGIDMYESLQACSEHLTQFGGHTMAAGLSLPTENFYAFREKFNSVIEEQCTGELFERVQCFDEVIQLAEINMDLYNQIQLLSPFGPEMEEPVFQAKHLIDTGYSRAVGSDQSHLSLSLQEAKTGVVMKGIFFKGAESLSLVKSKQPIDILFKLTLNTWNNQENIEIEIKDLRLSNS
jgi:single-stranded-DNA-specific exonuclease